MTGTGTAEIDFGAWPGSNEASVTVAAPGVAPGTNVEPWVMATDSTTDHTAADHKYFPAFAVLTAEAGTDEFIVHGRSTQKMQGAWAFHYVWAN